MSVTQGSFDYASLARQADDRADREESARSLAAKLAIVPAGLVGLSCHRWDQFRRLVVFLMRLGPTSAWEEAALRAGLSARQARRLREIVSPLGIVHFVRRYDAAGALRSTDRCEIDHAAIDELAAQARQWRRAAGGLQPGCNPVAARLKTTCGPPGDHLVTTWRPPGDHVPPTVADTARAYAGARAALPAMHESACMQSRVERMSESDWRELRPKIARVLQALRTTHPRTIRAAIVAWFVYAELLDDEPMYWEIVERAAGARQSGRYAHTAWRNEAIARGMPYHALARVIEQATPEWMLKRRDEMNSLKPER